MPNPQNRVGKNPNTYLKYFGIAPSARFFVCGFMICLQIIGGIFGFGSVSISEMFSIPVAQAAEGINQAINYQGKLMDSAGELVADGDYSIKFTIYNQSGGGTQLWTASSTNGSPSGVPIALDVTVTNGLFSILLGDTGNSQVAFPVGLFNNDSLYLGITIGADAEMTPRKRLSAVPYAFNSQTLQGQYASNTVANTGGDLFALHQGSADAATAARTTLYIETKGTSNLNDFLIRASDSVSDVFSVSRQGNVTTTGNLVVEGDTDLNNTLNVSATSTLADLALTGRVNSNLLPYITDTYTLGNSTYRWLAVTAQNISAVNVSSTNIDALGYVSTTNLYSNTALLGNATTTNIYNSGVVSTTQLYVNGVAVTGAGPTATLQQVTDAGATTNHWIQFDGATSTDNIVPSLTNSLTLGTENYQWLGIFAQNADFTNVSTTNLDASGYIVTNNLTATNADLTNVSSTNIDAANYISADTLISNSANLGDATTTNLYNSGVVSTTQLYVNGVAVTGIESQDFQDVTDLGVATDHWIQFAGATSTNHFLPGTNNLYNLGSLAYRWANLFAVNGNFTGTVTTTNLFASGYVSTTNLYVNGTQITGATPTLQNVTDAGYITNDAIGFAGASSTGHFLPTTNITYDLGSTSFRWRNLYASNGIFTNVSSTNIDALGYVSTTNLYSSFGLLGNVTSTNLYNSGVVSTTQLYVNGVQITGLGSGAQNLQEVTDEGYVTTNPIRVAGATSTDQLYVLGSQDAPQLIVQANATQDLENPLIQFRNSAGTVIGGINTNHESNIFAGYESGAFITSGTYNTALGYRTMYNSWSDITGGYNTAIGAEAMWGYSGSVMSGSDNTAVGYRGLASLSTGYGNTAVGYSALADNTTGYQNNAFGWGALGNNTTGLKNVAIGVESLSGNTNGESNTSVGNESMFNNNGDDNVAVGKWAMRLSATADQTVAIGASALSANNATGTTGVGYNALYSNTSGINISGVGHLVMENNSTGSNNTAMGASSLYYNQTGSGNTSLGSYALHGFTGTNHSNNTGVGYNSLYAVRTGSANTALGGGTLYALTTGASNTAIGYSAGANITTGSNNILIGNNVDSLSATGNYHLNIGNSIYGDLTNDNIGIGVPSPYAFKLTIDGHTGPSSTNAYDLGSSSLRWRNLYASNGIFTNVSSTNIDALGYVSTTNLYVNGSLVTGGTPTLQEVTDEGYITNDAIGVAGVSSTGHILPTATLTYDLGSSSNRWKDVWASSTYIGSSTWNLRQNAAGSFTIANVGGGERMTIDTSGNVGIGTNSPVSTFHISDGNTVSSTLFTSDYQIISAQNTAPGFNIISASGGSLDRGVFKATRSRGTLETPTAVASGDLTFSLLGAGYDGITAPATAAINFRVDGAVSAGNVPQAITFENNQTGARTERMRISSNGYVGIGTTAPGALMHINGNVGSLVGLRISRATTQYTDIRNNDAGGFHLTSYSNTDNRKAMVFENFYMDNGGAISGVNDFIFQSGSSTAQVELMRLSEAGNLGIGYSSPNHRLDVYGNLKVGLGGTGPRGYVGNAWNGANNYKMLILGSSYFNGTNYITNESTVFGSNAVSAIGAEADGRGVVFYTTPSSGNTQRTDSPATFNTYERMRIDAAGNVGIGDTSPAALLTVGSGDRFQVNTTGNLTRINNVPYSWPGANAAGILRSDAGGNLTWDTSAYLTSFTETDPTWSGSANTTATIGRTGAVGIGTISPGKTLDVDGQLRIRNGGATGYGLLEYGASATAANNWHVGSEGDGTFRFYNGTFGAGTERMRLTSGGNLGVGVSPNAIARLHVDGGEIVTSNSANSLRSVFGNYGLIHRNDGVDYYQLITASGDQYGNWNTLRPFSIKLATGNVNIGSNALTVLHGSNVGIGNTAPGSLLTVGASSQFQVNSSGNLVRVNNVPYSWPAANASGALSNDGSGNLTWAPGGVSGTGTDNRITRWNGTSAVQNSLITIDDSGYLYPSVNNSYDLGISTNAWRNAYFGSSVNIDYQGTSNVRFPKTGYFTASPSYNASGVDGIGFAFVVTSTMGDNNSLFALTDKDYNVALFAKNATHTAIAGDWLQDFALTVGGNVGPYTNLAHDLGSSSNRWNNVWGATVHVGTSTYSITQDDDGAFVVQNKFGTGILNINQGIESSIAMGFQTLENSTGIQNVALGHNSMYNNDDGEGNTAVGYESLFSNSSGIGNVGLGKQALRTLATGELNVAVGAGAGYTLLSGSGNIALGTASLYTNSTGDLNIAIGQEALYNNKAGGNNALGYSALRGNTTGVNNTGIGYHAGYANNSGNYNTSLGSEALFGSLGQSNSYNTAIGAKSLFTITTGASNTAVGFESLYSNDSGFQNTAVGTGALKANTSGFGNVAIGWNALDNISSGQSNSAVGVSSLGNLTSGNYNTTLGDRSGYMLEIGNYNTGIGYGSLSANTIGGTYEFDANTAVGAYALGRLNTGASSTAVGYQALFYNSAGDGYTAVGYQALFNAGVGDAYHTALGYKAAYNTGYNATEVYRNTAIGYESLYTNTGGGGNTVLGHQAAYGGTAENRVAIGESALYTGGASGDVAVGSGVGFSLLSTGGSFTGVGHSAGFSASSGNDLTFVGYNAGYYNTTAGQNTYIGSLSGYYDNGSNNTAVGYRALYGTVGSSNFYNTAIGSYALDGLSGGGHYNTALGYGAGGAITSGDYNVAIGYLALDSQTTAGGNIAIGYNALGSANSTGLENLAIGDAAGDVISSGDWNVMIGNDAGDLLTTGSANTYVGYHAGNANAPSASNVTLVGYGSDITGNFTNASAFGSFATVNANNKIRFGDSAVQVYEGQFNWTFPSDARIKTNIVDNPIGLTFINNIRPVKYESITDLGYTRDGFIAQEVRDTALSMGFSFSGVEDRAFVESGGTELLTMSYSPFDPILVNAIQEIYASSSPLWNGVSIDPNFTALDEPFMQVDQDGNIAYKGVSITSQGIATSSTQAFDSFTFSYKGSAWNADTAQEITTSFDVFNNTISATSSELKFIYTTGTGFTKDLLTISNSGDVRVSGDLHVGRRLYLGSKVNGEASTSTYIFVDDTLSPTSTYIATNADGWQTETTYDYAERYESSEELVPGDLVTADPTGVNLVKRATSPSEPLLGIVSTKPGFVTGRHYEGWYPVALAGRVPTRVSTMNGAIKAGDYITATQIPGVGAKAKPGENVIGMALESYSSPEEGLISVFVQAIGQNSNPENTYTTVTYGPEQPAEIPGVMEFAMIKAGQKEVNVSFESLGAFPSVIITPYGSVNGSCNVTNVKDTGFSIVLTEEQSFDLLIYYEVKLPKGNKIILSDGTIAEMDSLTGQVDFAPTPTEPTPEPEPEPETEVTPEPETEPEPEVAPETEVTPGPEPETPSEP